MARCAHFTLIAKARVVLAMLATFLIGQPANAQDTPCVVINNPSVTALMCGVKSRAESGDVDAQYEWGLWAAVLSQYDDAARWLRRAAEQGHVGAQLSLGEAYLTEEGVPRDETEAAKWLLLAAGAGNADAQFRLGALYILGQGVPQDHLQGHMWFNIAAARLPEGEKRERAKMLRDGVGRQLPYQQLLEAQRMAREWREQNPAERQQ